MQHCHIHVIKLSQEILHKLVRETYSLNNQNLCIDLKSFIAMHRGSDQLQLGADPQIDWSLMAILVQMRSIE